MNSNVVYKAKEWLLCNSAAIHLIYEINALVWSWDSLCCDLRLFIFCRFCAFSKNYCWRMNSGRSAAKKWSGLKQVENCRFCGQSGVFLGKIIKKGPSNLTNTTHKVMKSSGSNILIEPCLCLKRQCRFAHMVCLIKWIRTYLTIICPDCNTTYNVIHRITPLREWRTNPSTDKMTCQYFMAILMSLLIGGLDGFVMYLVWLTMLHVALRVSVMILLFAMYVAGLIAIYSRCVVLYDKMYLYNCPIVDIFPQEPEKPKVEKTNKFLAALPWLSVGASWTMHICNLYTI